jgi:hypothetical protein
MLKSQRSGIEVVAVLLSHAKLEIFSGHYVAASRLLDAMAAKMAAHHQSNSDDRLVSIYRAQIALETRDSREAVRQAEAALEFSRRTAIDPQSSAFIGEALLWRARRGCIGRQGQSDHLGTGSGAASREKHGHGKCRARGCPRVGIDVK